MWDAATYEVLFEKRLHEGGLSVADFANQAQTLLAPFSSTPLNRCSSRHLARARICRSRWRTCPTPSQTKKRERCT